MHTARRSALVTLVFLILASSVVTAGPLGANGERPRDRRAARILDQMPLPATSKVVRVRDRVRSYVVSSSTAQVLAFFREQLPMLGWTERSVGREAGQASGLDDTSGDTGRGGGPEVSNRGPDAGGLAGGTPRNVGVVDRATFARPDARMKIVVRSARNGRSQTDSNVENTSDQSTYRVSVKVR